MSGELTVLNQETDLQVGGQGVDFNNPLFKLKPSTLTIVQPQSQVEGAKKGHLRIVETNDQFETMYCTLLTMPVENRNWHIGNAGEMNRTSENLMCYSLDMIRPSEKSKIPQAVLCKNCSKADWAPYREYKDKNGKSNKSLIPSCDPFYRVFLIDTVYQLPLRMYIRSKARQPFEQGMQNIARVIAMAKAQHKNPNIYDVKFKLTTKLVQDGKYSYYIPVFSEPKLVNDEERTVFGAMYESFTASQNKQELDEVESETISQSQDNINAAVEGEYAGADQEITI